MFGGVKRMKWNRKGMLICAALFFCLFCFLTGRSLLKEQTQLQTPTYATEENIIVPEVASGAPINKEANTSVSEKKEKETKKTPFPNENKKERAKKKTTTKKIDKKITKTKKTKIDRKKKTVTKCVVTPIPTLEVTETPQQKTITFEIECKELMNHRDKWKEGIEEIIPSSGVFYSGEENYVEGETVYDVLKRICNEHTIALDSEYTPLYGTYYIKGIGNLYEFDCGSESGWLYKVNDSLPGVGCSSHVINENDKICFYYSLEK